MSKSKHERRFLLLWQSFSDIELEREKMIIPERRYRFDFVHAPSKVAIEIQGGIWSRGKSGHKSGTGLTRDYEKFNLAQLNGWKVFLLGEGMISRPWLEMISNHIALKQ